MIDQICKESIRDGENRFSIFEEMTKQFVL